MCACVHACVRTGVRACGRAGGRACVRACVRVCVRACVCWYNNALVVGNLRETQKVERISKECHAWHGKCGPVIEIPLLISEKVLADDAYSYFRVLLLQKGLGEPTNIDSQPDVSIEMASRLVNESSPHFQNDQTSNRQRVTGTSQHLYRDGQPHSVQQPASRISIGSRKTIHTH